MRFERGQKIKMMKLGKIDMNHIPNSVMIELNFNESNRKFSGDENENLVT